MQMAGAAGRARCLSLLSWAWVSRRAELVGREQAGERQEGWCPCFNFIYSTGFVSRAAGVGQFLLFFWESALVSAIVTPGR